MLALAESQAEPRRPLLPLSALPLTEVLGPVVMADDPCEAASATATPTGASKYYRARYYDPKIGRFISEDPVGFTGGINFYAYVGNRPVNATDPMGLFSFDVHYLLTFRAARMAGLGLLDAHQLAFDVQYVDFREGSQDSGSSLLHAMSNTKHTYDGSDFRKLVRGLLESGDLAAALHALQDFHAEGHRGFQVWDGNLRLKHVLDDTCPDPATLRQSLSDSLYMIRQFMNRGGQPLPDSPGTIEGMDEVWRSLQ